MGLMGLMGHMFLICYMGPMWLGNGEGFPIRQGCYEQVGDGIMSDGLSVEIIRDRWGIPHVYGEDERAVFYGLGVAMAEDRLFQMCLKRREAVGRLAEILGAGDEGKFVESDRLVLTLDLAGAAERELAFLDERDRLNLEAFARGVNAYLDENWEGHSALFAKYGGKPEPWRASDSLAIWARLSLMFSMHWKGEALAKRAFEKNPGAYRKSNLSESLAPRIDDAAAVVSEEEFARSYPDAYAKLKAIGEDDFEYVCPDFGPTPPKMSHNWVVSGARSTTGKPIVQGKPQSTVQCPSMKYEFHITGGRYNARGTTWPGVPACLIGFNEHCAWTATALNTDAGDLFEERVNPDDAGQYLFMGRWKSFSKRSERIPIKDGETISLEIAESIHGPVVNELVEGVEAREVFALKTSFLDAGTSSVGAVFGMMRARDWDSVRGAMSGYCGPGGHFVYGDVHGDIGYQGAVKIPARRYRRTLPRQGWTGEDEWEILPFEFMPSMKNPKANYIGTANCLPFGAWHPFVTCDGVGGGPRSWRVKELFEGDRVFSVEDFVNEIHRDSVSVGVRDFAALALAIVDEDGCESETVSKAAEELRRWDGKMLTDSPGFGLANSILELILKSLAGADWHADRAMRYATGWGEFLSMLRGHKRELDSNGSTPKEAKLRAWFVETLKQACEWPESSDPPWDAAGMVHEMPYQNNGWFGSLAPELDQASPPLRSPITQTLWSQRGESYDQIVDLSDVDRSLAFTPPGNSERPESAHFLDQAEFWKSGTLHPAPISREGVEKIRESLVVLKVGFE